MIIEAFRNKIFPLSNPDYYPEYTSEKDTLSRSSISSDSEDISPRGATDKSDFTADDLDKLYIGNADDLYKLLIDTEKYLDPNLIKKYFFNRSLKKISEFLKHKKNSRIELALIKNGLKGLKLTLNICLKMKEKVKNLIY